MAESPIDQGELRRKLLANEITWQVALSAITSFKSPPWKTKEWRAKREALLVERCQQCGSTDQPLILQHTWQPRPIRLLFQETRNKYSNEWNEWIGRNPLQVDLSDTPEDTNVCPKCLSPTIRFRKKAKDWKCVASVRGVFCHHVFEVPARTVSEAVVKELRKKAWVRALEEFDTAFGIGKQVVLLAIEQHSRYISMQDTTTLCKRCAFVADRTDLVLCVICRENFHSRTFSRCASCASVSEDDSV